MTLACQAESGDEEKHGDAEKHMGRGAIYIYAIKSGFLARKDNGTRRISISQISSAYHQRNGDGPDFPHHYKKRTKSIYE